MRGGLEERTAADGDDAAVARRCAVALADLDRAQLSTIHAFGQGLLRTMAAEAGIDPEMTALDQLAAERRFDERWRAALERVDPDGAEGRALDRALGRGLTLRGLRELAAALMEREDIAAAILAEPPSAPAPEWHVIPSLRDRLTALPLESVAEEDACLRHIEDLLELIDDTTAADEWERDTRLAGAAPVCERKLARTGNRTNWRGDARGPGRRARRGGGGRRGARGRAAGLRAPRRSRASCPGSRGS